MLLYSDYDAAVGAIVFLIILIVALVVIEILFIVACGKKASAKGRSVELWVIIALFFGGLIPYIILCCLPDESSHYSGSYQSYKPRMNANEEEYGRRYSAERASYRNVNTGSVNNHSNSLHKNCPYCGVRNEWETKNCINCGKPLD